MTAACLIVMIMALTGCGLLPFGNKDDTRTPAPPPPSMETAALPPPEGMAGMDSPVLSSGTALAPPSPDATLEGYVQVPAPPPEPMDPLAAAGPLQLGDEGSMGALGLNLEEYFDSKADTSDRIGRLERAVAAIQRDLRTLAPPIQRLITVERDIDALVTQLSELTQAPSTSPPTGLVRASSPYSAPGGAGGAAPTPPPVTAAPASLTKTVQAQAPPTGGPVTVKGLRIGEHPDKTRIVLDASGPAPYSHDLDNGEHLLVIELSGAGWSGKTQETVKSPLIASYTVSGNGSGGSRVVVLLKKDTAVTYESVLKPNGTSNYRIVIDLKK